MTCLKLFRESISDRISGTVTIHSEQQQKKMECKAQSESFLHVGMEIVKGMIYYIVLLIIAFLFLLFLLPMPVFVDAIILAVSSFVILRLFKKHHFF